MNTRAFIGELEDQRIVSAITEAEKRTSGEIRVFVSHKPTNDPVTVAIMPFMRLGMDRTKLRTGVLIYFAPVSQNFAIIGDTAIHEKCGDDFWQQVSLAMTELLKQKKFTEAILAAVERTGRVLAGYFPFEPGDKNELPNQLASD